MCNYLKKAALVVQIHLLSLKCTSSSNTLSLSKELSCELAVLPTSPGISGRLVDAKGERSKLS